MLQCNEVNQSVDAEETVDQPEISLFAKIALEYPLLVQQETPHSQHCSDKTLSKYMDAMAAANVRCQQDTFQNLAKYVQQMSQAKSLRGVLFIHHTLYDETPQKLRVPFKNLDGSMPTEAESQIAKAVVIENRWAMLLHDLRNLSGAQDPYIFLTGHLSTSVHAGERATSECFASMVLNSFQPDASCKSSFQTCLRLVETDEGGANMRAENLLKPSWPHAQLLHIPCLAHKAHTAAKFLFKQSADLLKGIIRVSLVMTQPGVVAAIKLNLQREIAERLVWTQVDTLHPLPADAICFRDGVLRFFFASQNTGVSGD